MSEPVTAPQRFPVLATPPPNAWATFSAVSRGSP